jgi:hypothetical protein
MHRIILLIYWVSFSQSLLHAQPDSELQEMIMDTTDHTVADFQVDYRFGIMHGSPADEIQWNRTTLIKFEMPETPGPTSGFESFEEYWVDQLFAQMMDRSVTAYQDSFCIFPLTLSARAKRLISQEINRNSCEPIYLLDFDRDSALYREYFGEGFQTTIIPDRVVGMRVQHRVVFSKSKAMPQLQAIAWAPLCRFYDFDTQTSRYEPIFWFPIELKQTNNAEIAPPQWIVETKNKLVTFDTLQIRQGQLDKSAIIKQLFEDKNLTYIDHNFTVQPELPFGKITSVDSLADPSLSRDDHEDASECCTNLMRDFVAFRFLTRWYWYSNRKKLAFQPIAFIPVLRYYNVSGELRYLGDLFYVMPKE